MPAEDRYGVIHVVVDTWAPGKIFPSTGKIITGFGDAQNARVVCMSLNTEHHQGKDDLLKEIMWMKKAKDKAEDIIQI